MKPYLALIRAGKSSLHPYAVARLAEQNFDYALSWFADEHPADIGMADGAAFVHMQKGAKWPGLEQTLIQHWDQIQKYRYIWLPDDDLLAEPEQVSRMFTICDELQLDLAQPALTRDSYFSHLISMQHTEFQLRFTNFVEIMAPILSTDMLGRVFHTLKGQVSGYGLDGLWPRFSQLGKVAIIDDTPVKHTRPVGGPNYQHSKDAGLSPAHEDWLVSAGAFVETPADYHINFGGLLQSGDPICIGSTADEANALLRAVLSSSNGLKTNALALTRYLANHYNYWSGGEHGARYPRALVRVVLNQALKHAGIRFPKPADLGSNTAAHLAIDDGETA
ncbi:MAG: DUF707 domain-containing protein [Rubrivivax sp.]